MPTTRSKRVAASTSSSANNSKADTTTTASDRQTSNKSASPPIKSETTSSPSPSPSTSTTLPNPPSKPTPPRAQLITPPPQPLPTPALTSPPINYTYAILRGEQLVLTFEPYKSLILPYWAFRTVAIARASCAALLVIFESYVGRGDFVGADMTRKFVQMGMTRARRYANWKGGRKYVVPKEKGGDGRKRERWERGTEEERQKRREKEQASEVFKAGWRSCVEDEAYRALKERWVGEKREWERLNKAEVGVGDGEGVVKAEKEQKGKGKRRKVKKEEEGDGGVPIKDEDGDEGFSGSE